MDGRLTAAERALKTAEGLRSRWPALLDRFTDARDGVDRLRRGESNPARREDLDAEQTSIHEALRSTATKLADQAMESLQAAWDDVTAYIESRRPRVDADSVAAAGGYVRLAETRGLGAAINAAAKAQDPRALAVLRAQAPAIIAQALGPRAAEADAEDAKAGAKESLDTAERALAEPGSDEAKAWELRDRTEAVRRLHHRWAERTELDAAGASRDAINQATVIVGMEEQALDGPPPPREGVPSVTVRQGEAVWTPLTAERAAGGRR